MEYQHKDFLSDISFNFGKEVRNQSINFYKPSTSTPIDSCEDEYTKYILKLNDIIRVDHKSHYKLHKTYPSPRSLYKIGLFVANSNNTLTGKHHNSDSYFLSVYEENKTYKGDVYLFCKEDYPSYYNNIKKTLFLLEAGHLIFNIVYIGSIFGFSFEIENNTTT